MDRAELIAAIKSVIISKKGGIHISDINEEYKVLMGENIPLKSGKHELLTFLNSVPGVTVAQGVITATGENTAHIEKLIANQKTKVELNRYRRAQVKRLNGAKKNSTLRYTNQTFQSSQSSTTKNCGRPSASHHPRYKSNQRQQSSHQRNYLPPQFKDGTANRNFPSHYGNCNFTNDQFIGQNCQKVSQFEINGWRCIGDDLMLSILNHRRPYQYDNLCRSGLTLRAATNEIRKYGCPEKVIILLGSVDVLIGNSEWQIKKDMFNLLHAIHACGSDMLVCTLPALGNISHRWDRVKALTTLNSCIVQSFVKVTDLHYLFSNRDWTIDYTCYELEPVYVSGCSEPHLLWSERGRDIVRHTLHDTTGFLNGINFCSRYTETDTPSRYYSDVYEY